ncbi:MAG TPA: LytR C-terminal domain-containing protein [Candidatus Eisenbacteria bacterium]|nr:LytR C-terminal domain-containing protein [Candidatus Eisenbacteria bacterium]
MARARGKPRRPPGRGEAPSRGLGIAIALTAMAVGVLGLSALWGRDKRAPEPPGSESVGSTAATATPGTKPAAAPVQAHAAKGIRVEVLNGSGQEGVGGKVAAVLRDGGFQVVSVRNADRFDYPRTLVAARGADVGRAQAVAHKLDGSQIIRQRAPVDWDVTVVVGRDQARALADKP